MRAQGHPLDAAVLVDNLIRSVDWGHNAGTIQVLLVPDDLRLRPARYNFAASNGTAASPYHVIVVSLARLQDHGLWGGDDRHPGRTAERVQKLVAKNVAKVSGYGGSTRCIFAFPRNRDELDALPEGFCEPDLSGPTRVRRFLSRFLVVVVVALTIEGLVATFKAAHEDPGHLLYAASIVVAAGVLLAGWGLFVRLNRYAEELEPEAMADAKREDIKLK